jgi:hypothetical protein
LIQRTPQCDGFWPLQLHSKNLRIHRDSNSQSGSSLRSVRVYSLMLSCTLGSMHHDSRLPFWPATLQPLALVTSPRLGLRQLRSCDIKLVMTNDKKIINHFEILEFNYLSTLNLGLTTSIMCCLYWSNSTSQFVGIFYYGYCGYTWCFCIHFSTRGRF